MYTLFTKLNPTFRACRTHEKSSIVKFCASNPDTFQFPQTTKISYVDLKKEIDKAVTSMKKTMARKKKGNR